MTSTSQLAWLDYDPASRDRTQRILALFRQKEARDELGLAAIRDSIADLLFPGTSTIQTRLRYILFVPWLYQSLEDAGVTSASAAKEGRKLETRLVGPLLQDSNELGVFGRRAKGDIKRLPSSVYWAGLRSWGILTIDASQEEYHRGFDAIQRARSGTVRPDDGASTFAVTTTWREGLPAPPDSFPDQATLALRREEAEWLRDRIQDSHGESLLAYLAARGIPQNAEWPWDVADLPGMTRNNRDLLEHARRFSSAMHGASLLYNLALARRRDVNGLPRRPELADHYLERLQTWWQDLEHDALKAWDLDAFWAMVQAPGHIITASTRAFVAMWRATISASSDKSVGDDAAQALVENREKIVKGRSRSRFLNDRAYDQWGGESGARPLSFRWPTASQFVRDLHAGLGAT